MEPQPLFQGLPDDLALRCLTRLSHGYHGVLECVCKKWRDLIRSSEYANYKAKEGCCGDWLFALTEEQTNFQWIAYDPEADSWHPLPKIAWSKSDVGHYGFSCVCVHNKLFVIGGHYMSKDTNANQSPLVSNDVIQFDPFKEQWSKVASMRTPRSSFACAVVCGKVYVAGGWNSSSERIVDAEVYDPLEDRWEDLPQLPRLRKDCRGISYKGHFCVFGGKMDSAIECTSEVFGSSDWTWHTVESLYPFGRMGEFAMTSVGSRLYTISEWGNSIKAEEVEQGEWSVIGSVPSVFLQEHTRPLESFGYGFVGVGRYIYVLGGKVLRWDKSRAPRFDITKLNLVRFCDPTILPLKWREARPMHGVRGAVIGCCSLHH